MLIIPMKGGALGGLVDNPFGTGYGRGVDEGRDEDDWVCLKDKISGHNFFKLLNFLLSTNIRLLLSFSLISQIIFTQLTIIIIY
jgi:hypothetical protein